MAKLTYFATLDESIMILEDLLSIEGMEAVYDRGAFPKPEFHPTKDISEEIRAWHREHGFVTSAFLVGPYTKGPPGFYVQRYGPRTGQFIPQYEDGGPLIDFRFGAFDEFEGAPTLTFGGLVHPGFNINLETGQRESPSPALKSWYQKLCRRMQRHVHRHKLDFWSIYLTPTAVDLYTSGKARIHLGGDFYTSEKTPLVRA